MLAVFPNCKWAISGYTGQAAVPTDGWFSLSLNVGPTGAFQAIIDGNEVAKGDDLMVESSFPFLGSSYGNGASFRDLCIAAYRDFPSAQPGPAPPAPVPPAPAPGAGLVMTECA